MPASDVLYVPGYPIPGYSNEQGLDPDLERHILAHAIAGTARALGVYDDRRPLKSSDLLVLLADIRDAYGPLAPAPEPTQEAAHQRRRQAAALSVG